LAKIGGAAGGGGGGGAEGDENSEPMNVSRLMRWNEYHGFGK
jgi:hypothetical protein